ncbi:hypothetical protein ACFL2Q_18550 [Thermodesulfobacteriota bacterium]
MQRRLWSKLMVVSFVLAIMFGLLPGHASAEFLKNGQFTDGERHWGFQYAGNHQVKNGILFANDHKGREYPESGSVFQDISGISAGTQLKLTAQVRNEKQINRQAWLDIYELANKAEVEVLGEASSGKLSLGNDWRELAVSFTKKHDDSIIRVEIYWSGQDPINVMIDNASLSQASASTESHRMRLLLDITGEYGWSHKGHESKGGNWGRWACNQSLEQIRGRIASMTNLQELESFTSRDLKNSVDAAGKFSSDSVEIKIAGKHAMSSVDQSRWVNRNNLLIDVGDVRIKPGTDWTKTSQNWKGERSWEASATMLYRLRIFGR